MTTAALSWHARVARRLLPAPLLRLDRVGHAPPRATDDGAPPGVSAGPDGVHGEGRLRYSRIYAEKGR